MYIKLMSFVEVAEEILAVIQNSQQTDASYERRKFRHKAHYSLDREDGIENDALAGLLPRRKSWSRNSCGKKCILH